MDYNEIDIPIYSIVSGKQMGDLKTELAKAFKVSIDEVKRRMDINQTPPNQRIGIIRSSLPSIDWSDDGIFADKE